MQLDAPIILATGDLPKNAPLEQAAAKNGIHFFSGSEDDVLQRFIDCAAQFGLKKVLRVCADNPFLDTGLNKALISDALNENADYASFSIEGKPVILSHYGFFTELVSVEALTRAHAVAAPFDREHVTRYLYNRPAEFSLRLEEVPADIKEAKDVRLTVDTAADFSIAAVILRQLLAIHSKFDYSYKDVLSELRRSAPDILRGMKEQIIENSKS